MIPRSHGKNKIPLTRIRNFSVCVGGRGGSCFDQIKETIPCQGFNRRARKAILKAVGRGIEVSALLCRIAHTVSAGRDEFLPLFTQFFQCLCGRCFFAVPQRVHLIEPRQKLFHLGGKTAALARSEHFDERPVGIVDRCLDLRRIGASRKSVHTFLEELDLTVNARKPSPKIRTAAIYRGKGLSAGNLRSVRDGIVGKSDVLGGQYRFVTEKVAVVAERRVLGGHTRGKRGKLCVKQTDQMIERVDRHE